MMEKLHMETQDLTQKNIEKIEDLFPEVITEVRDENGQLRHGVNFELLKQLLSDVPSDNNESYEFTWVGKNASIVEANKPIRKTLRPCKEESKNWDSTQNVYIEGDNLDALKILQESYLGKIKMIYIDPPYNTGSDRIYKDSFNMDEEEYIIQSNLFDENNNRNFKPNPSSNPRFHSDWCSMIYARLLLARNFLSEDGAIFIHIDEHEACNLEKICNEVFGELNFLGAIIWDKRNPKGAVVGVAYQHETVLVYARRKDIFATVPFTKDKEHAVEMLKKASALIESNGSVNNKVRESFKQWLEGQNNRFSGGELAYSLIDDAGLIYQLVSMAAPDKPETRSHRPLIHPITGKQCPVPSKGWRFTDQTMDILLKSGKIEFGKNESTQPRQKYYLKDNLEEAFSSVIYYGGSDDAMQLPFDNPKPLYIAEKLVKSVCKDKNSIVMDFFSGSATVAHAVMHLNAEDNGYRKFIMMQIPEECKADSAAFKAGYKNICEIGKERIRRAGEKIKSESPLTTTDLDIGFRVFKVDESNMKDVYYSAGEYSKDIIKNSVSNIKDDRTDLDLLYGCLLDWGVHEALALPYKCEKIGGFDVHTVNDGDLVACFSKDVSEKVILEIAKRKPLRAVFRDSSFSTSPEKINVTEIFKLLSPDTTVKVI